MQSEGEELLLVSFLDEPTREQRTADRSSRRNDVSRIAELEHELDATRKELQSAIRDLEISNEEQKAINEEAMSVNEEFQSTNEELMTSKEELQSLNEELTALNSQLQETLERQRGTSNDLQNILDSSDVATLFLDSDLNIRFFTPAAKSLFRVIASDIGRPLADLTPLAADRDLLADARSGARRASTPLRREIEAEDGAWYNRRILPYRTKDNRIEGVVITFADISEIKAAEREIQAARAYSDSIIDTIRQPLVVLDEELRVVSANRSFYELSRSSPRRRSAACSALAGDHPLRYSGAARLSRPDPRASPPGSRITRSSSSCRCSADGPAPQCPEDPRRVRSAERKILLAIDDVTERKRAAEAVEAARRQAEQANLGKSRFLAAASHDLRQPLQTISLLQGLLAKKIKDEGALQLVGSSTRR